ncbi:MAG: 50S ribosome-binding GTPase [Flavobacteriales bacterium]|jgi:sulfate adenylyltransferase subunit 1|uniref:sulfate adenylyltransferase subunit 1 n=1 Tax=Blattabacterium sp. (Mastotermes darwiniensis) TaxID=39768 RepID=UPI000231DE4D|nr:GTP-binding protein [Blattabacterium sp. (Mastotermes darwiniensis)]AER40641.1 sulfate adenylyltransferase subunit 1 [Blattabacterium sp. (Mastotermes darwiniensis) str. MADAR]MDR1804831.1 50S ribosome-binding GTPase [Flavobacteriales bacterium]
MDTLRFITSGSVDNGKSTLIGRLLYDSDSILMDELSTITEKSSIRRYGGNKIDFSLLTDGLRAEREQGITIDVAYKYFSTSKRKFIIADTPGHFQYTRNMLTGASHADLAIVLIDARYGVVEQIQRHSLILGLLNFQKIILAINKMDLINYDFRIYKAIISQYKVTACRVGLKNIDTIPISAKNGDNVVDQSSNMKWYTGPSLLSLLENIVIHKEPYLEPSRFPVQYIIRSKCSSLHKVDRGYAGKIISGIYREGDDIIVYPHKFYTKIRCIKMNGKKIKEGFAPQNIIIYLEDEMDISRGDLFVKKNSDDLPIVSKEFDAILCWMENSLLKRGNKYLFQIHSLQVPILIKDIIYRIDVNTLKREKYPKNAGLNDLVKVRIHTSKPIPHDPYRKIKENGASILIDEISYSTVAACMIQ